MEQYQGADALIEVLNANGIEHIFFNPGGDICPLQVALLRYKSQERPAPKLVLCLHESVALTAAHGHYMVSGKPQMVMVHSELGTQQVAGALHNAQWGRIPVVLMAGLMGGPQRTNWKGEPFDQGMMVRNCVKWDHLIDPDSEDMHEVMQRAFDIAFAEPRGPVYLTYPREALTKKLERRQPETYRHNESRLPPAEWQGIEKIADALLAAKNPLIVAGYNARYPETVKSLIELAETSSTPVMPGLTRMNFPTTHPLCAGMEEMGGGSEGNIPLTQADVVVAIDYDLPYVPAAGTPKTDATIFQIDVDPLTQGRMLWGRGAGVFVKADSREAIPSLNAVIRNKLTPQDRIRLRERAVMLEARHNIQREQRRIAAMGQSGQKPVSPDWVCYCLNQVMDKDAILVNHLISQSSSVAAQIDRTQPNTLLACAGGSIMWAPGAAFGAKVAEPGKTVVSLVTDGGFVWGCPVATLWSANSFRSPFMLVIFNNQSYRAIRSIVENMTESRLSDEQAYLTGVDISPPADYAAVARGCGAYGRTVDDPADVLAALKEGLGQVRSGKLAVIDILLPRGV
jgi:acetolactate synthase I/II/III large subunit